jgi:hypothetical protein
MWRAYTGVIIHCVFDQIPNLQNCFTTQNKTWEGRGPQTPAPKSLYWSIFKKSRHLGIGVSIDIWSKEGGGGTGEWPGCSTDKESVPPCLGVGGARQRGKKFDGRP